MPGYIQALLTHIKHPMPHCTQYSPIVDHIQTNTIIPTYTTAQIQVIVGSLLYYQRMIDPTIGLAVSRISQDMIDPTQHTQQTIMHLLNHVATHQNIYNTHYASGIKLRAYADAAYLNEPKARSRYACHIYLTGTREQDEPDLPNCGILTVTKPIKHVVTSPTEAEYTGIYHTIRR